MNTYIHEATAVGKLDPRAESPVERVLFSNGDGGLEATGVEYVDAEGERHTIEEPAPWWSPRAPSTLRRS